MMLTNNGICVLISSTDETLVDNIKLLFEKFIRTSIVFYTQPIKTSSVTLPWLWNVSGTCDYMIVDLDTCAWEDIMAALLKDTSGARTVIFYSEKERKREAIKLINAAGRDIIFSNMDDLNNFLDIDTQYPGPLDE